MDCHNNLQRCQEYIAALEDERRKIQVFHRELPLCLELVTQAIFACKQQLSLADDNNNNNNSSPNRQSDCSVQTTTTATSEEGPVLEEFIPIKANLSSDSDAHEEDEEEHRRSSSQIDSPNDTKSDWLRSAQLWNDQPPNQPIECLTKSSLTEGMRNGGGAFKPFRGEIKSGVASNTITPAPAPVAASCTTADTVASVAAATRSSGSGGAGGDGCRREEKDGDVLQRKARRCWSPELHRRFLQALEQLGGAHLATPKQIRDLMKVEGLTNDEVKSHLQKYRLHTRRPSGGSNASVRSSSGSGGDPQAAQFVVVGGIWVQPPEYAGAPATASSSGDAAPNKIYKPAAVVPPSSAASATKMRANTGSIGSHTDGGRCFSSPTTSSSTHTTTASPVF